MVNNNKTMVSPSKTTANPSKTIVQQLKAMENSSKTMLNPNKTMVNPIKSMANLSKTQSKVNPDKFESWICWTSFHSSTLLLQTSSNFCIGMRKIDEIEHSRGCVVFVNSLFCSIFSCFSWMWSRWYVLLAHLVVKPEKYSILLILEILKLGRKEH